jgi:hypothetical protein
MGEVAYTQHGIASFDLISLFAPPRGVLIEQFSIMCRWQFGDGRCHMTVLPLDRFPYEFATTLSDPPIRNFTYVAGVAQRYRFGSDGTPEDFHNVYLEAQVQLGGRAQLRRRSLTWSATSSRTARRSGRPSIRMRGPRVSQASTSI